MQDRTLGRTGIKVSACRRARLCPAQGNAGRDDRVPIRTPARGLGW
jgi:hypothetical protein